MSNSACPGCSVPMHNRVAEFAFDPFLAAGFSINLLTFFAAVAVAGYSFWQLRPKRLGGNVEYHFYGLRIALVFFVASLFFQWLYMAIPNAMQVESSYIVFDLVPAFFQFATETILVYTFARTALQPLVHVRGFGKARGVALGLSIPFGLVVAADWISDAVILGLELNTIAREGDLDSSSDVAFAEQFESTGIAAIILQLTYNAMSITWGLVFMGMSIHALRKSRNALESRFRAVPKLMIGASIVWIIRSATIVILNLFFGYAFTGSSTHAFVYLELAPILAAIGVNVLLLVIFVLLLLAFRPHLASMYVDGALSERLGSQTNDVYYQE